MFSYVGESEFRKEAKEVVLKNEVRVPVLLKKKKKLSLRRVFELSKEISQSDNVISKVISTVLNQEIDDNFVDIKWREMTELSDSQKQFVLFVLQAEAALYVTVENQILDEVNEELNETPVEEQTRKVLEAVTSVLYSLSISQMKRDMLQELLENQGDKIPVELEYVARAACRAAIKAHDELTPELAKELLHRLGECRQGTLCPHGRPTMVTISYREIEKRFGRR